MAIGHGGDAISSRRHHAQDLCRRGSGPGHGQARSDVALGKGSQRHDGSSLQPAKDAKVAGHRHRLRGRVRAPPASGIDEAAIQSSIIDQLVQADAPANITVGGKFVTIQPSVSDQTAQAAIDAAGKMVVDVNLTAGDKTWKIAADTVRSWIIFGFRQDSTYGPVVDPQPVATYISHPEQERHRSRRRAQGHLHREHADGAHRGQARNDARRERHRAGHRGVSGRPGNGRGGYRGQPSRWSRGGPAPGHGPAADRLRSIGQVVRSPTSRTSPTASARTSPCRPSCSTGRSSAPGRRSAC